MSIFVGVVVCSLGKFLVGVSLACQVEEHVEGCGRWGHWGAIYAPPWTRLEQASDGEVAVWVAWSG